MANTTSSSGNATGHMPPLPPISPETTYEQAYQQLAQVVELLEAGQLSLDESLVLYERGQQLVQFCQGRLENAELRIEQLSTHNSAN
jgi:exodeoxyribonuclease VII small subunit